MTFRFSLFAAFSGTFSILELSVLHLGHAFPQFEDLLLANALYIDDEPTNKDGVRDVPLNVILVTRIRITCGLLSSLAIVFFGLVACIDRNAWQAKHHYLLIVDPWEPLVRLWNLSGILGVVAVFATREYFHHIRIRVINNIESLR